MEILFENKVDFTKGLMTDAYSYYFRQKNKKMNVVLLAVAAVFAVGGVVAAVVGQAPVALVGFLLAAALCYRAFFAHSAHVDRVIKKSRGTRLFGEKTVQVYHDKVRVADEREHVDYPLAALSGFWIATNMYILEFGGLLVVLNKTGFVKGTDKEFEDFMEKQAQSKNGTVE